MQDRTFMVEYRKVLSEGGKENEQTKISLFLGLVLEVLPCHKFLMTTGHEVRIWGNILTKLVKSIHSILTEALFLRILY